MSFDFTKYWVGESHWATNVLPKEIDRICRDPLADRIFIRGPIGSGKTRLARIIAVYKRYVRLNEDGRKILLGAIKGKLSPSHIPHYSELNVALIPPQSAGSAGLSELFGYYGPFFGHSGSGLPGVFERAMYKDKENSTYVNYLSEMQKYNRELEDIAPIKKDTKKKNIGKDGLIEGPRYKTTITQPPDIEEFPDGNRDQLTGGVVFLDEIVDAAPECQAGLLTVVADGFFNRVGLKKCEQFEGTIIGATWKDIHELTAKDLFRKDLFSRFIGNVITIPPLANRKEDIYPIAKEICKELNEQYESSGKTAEKLYPQYVNEDYRDSHSKYKISVSEGDTHKIRLSDIKDDLMTYDWSNGDVRELRYALKKYISYQGKVTMKDIINNLKDESTKRV
jgi:hypothetical protein